MPVITSTELGATGRYINLGSPSGHDNLATRTVIAYARPQSSGALLFLYAKGNSSSVGPRLQISTSSRNFAYGGGSNSGVNPTSTSANNAVTLNSWAHFQATATRSISASDIDIFLDAGADAQSSSGAGTTAAADDSARDIFLMNRVGLGREFVGDLAYVAVWNRILTADERGSARTNGPLSVPSGLILLWANDQDYSTSGLTAIDRSPRVTGSLPPNTALGISDMTAAAGVATVSVVGEAIGGNSDFVPAAGVATASAVGEAVGGNSDATPAAGAATVAVAASSTAAADVTPAAGSAVVSAVGIQFNIRDDYERSSVNVGASTISGAGDSAIITLRPRLQESQVVSSQTRWLEPSARVDGVNGFRPTFRFDLYVVDGDGGMHGSWPSTRRAKFSYDRLTWFDFDNTTRSTVDERIEFRHNTAFTEDTVYISRSRQTSVTQTGQWLADTAAASSGLMVPAASAVAYTPGSGVAGYPAQTFIADEFAAQIDELGRTIPSTPFYAAEINDTSLMPTDGSAKRLAIVTTGCHCGEDHGDFVSRGFITNLLGSSAQAQAVRRRYRVLVYPMINAPGRCGGGWRGSFTQGAGGADDANRNFDRDDSLLEIVDIPKAAITSDRSGAVPDWSIDFHSMRLETWGAYFRSSGLIEKFGDRITAETGDFVDDRGSLASSSISGYFGSIGVLMNVTHESGDPSPVTDADITDHTAGMVRALDSMMSDGLFYSYVTPAEGVATVSSTGASTAAAGVTAAGGVATVSVVGASTFAATVTPAAGSATVAVAGSAGTAGNADADVAEGVAAVSAVGASTASASFVAAAGAAAASAIASAMAAATATAAAGVATVSAEQFIAGSDFEAAAGAATVSVIGRAIATSTAQVAAAAAITSASGASFALTAAVVAAGAATVFATGSDGTEPEAAPDTNFRITVGADQRRIVVSADQRRIQVPA